MRIKGQEKSKDWSGTKKMTGNISEIRMFRIDMNEALDMFIAEINWRYEKLMEVANDFGLGIVWRVFRKFDWNGIEESSHGFGERDINGTEFIDEISDFQHAVLAIIPDRLESASVLELLQLIQDFSLKASYPNIDIA